MRFPGAIPVALCGMLPNEKLVIWVTICSVDIGMKNWLCGSGGDNLCSGKMEKIVSNNQNMLIIGCGSEKVDIDSLRWKIGGRLRGNWFFGCFPDLQLASGTCIHFVLYQLIQQ